MVSRQRDVRSFSLTGTSLGRHQTLEEHSYLLPTFYVYIYIYIGTLVLFLVNIRFSLLDDDVHVDLLPKALDSVLLQNDDARFLLICTIRIVRQLREFVCNMDEKFHFALYSVQTPGTESERVEFNNCFRTNSSRWERWLHAIVKRLSTIERR